MTRDRFLALSNSVLKEVSGKNCSKVGIILEVNSGVVVETLMAKRCIADYINTFLRGFAYFVLYCTLFCRYISSKVEPSFVEECKIAACFGGVHQYFR